MNVCMCVRMSVNVCMQVYVCFCSLILDMKSRVAFGTKPNILALQFSFQNFLLDPSNYVLVISLLFRNSLQIAIHHKIWSKHPHVYVRVL